MSEFSSKFLWERVSEGGAMDSCYKLYTWINHTILMLLLQILWKLSQISDYFKETSVIESKPNRTFVLSPLTRESKYRRHIRSMSDVHCSTPYRIPFRSRKGSVHTLTYDSDTRSRRVRSHRRFRELDSSESSDYADSPKKIHSIERKIIKYTDSMRIL